MLNHCKCDRAASQAEDVEHPATANDKRIRHELAVTSPGNRLSTHQSRRAIVGQVQELLSKGLPEFRRLHVVGVGAEAGVLPVGMR